MSEAINFDQPKITETTLVANCKRCGTEVYKEVTLEKQGVPFNKLTYGTFSQEIDLDGNLSGPITPFCECEKQMPVVNNGLNILRDRTINTGAKAGFIVDSLGFGGSNIADGAGPSYTVNVLGAGSTGAYFKSGSDVTKTTGGDGTVDPFWQFEATFATNEISTGASDTIVLFEIGTSSGALTGTNPAGNNGTRLFTRKRIGGSSGIGKTQDIDLVGRVKVTY